jgi:hypothetical protein
MELWRSMLGVTGSQNSHMTATKLEVLESQLLCDIETKLQRLLLHSSGPAFERSLVNAPQLSRSHVIRKLSSNEAYWCFSRSAYRCTAKRYSEKWSLFLVPKIKGPHSHTMLFRSHSSAANTATCHSCCCDS